LTNESHLRVAKAGVRIEPFPQTPANLTAASQNLFELIQAQNLVAYPDPSMRLAISRAIASETSRGRRITKEKQSHTIDVVIALAMAAYATIQGRDESTYNLDAFSRENFNWQSLRTFTYLSTGGRVFLPGGYNR